MHKINECIKNTIWLHSKGLFVFVSILWLVCAFSLRVNAEVVYENENGYQGIIEDKEGKLSEMERTKLVQAMQPITEYGNVALVIQSDFQYGGYLYSQEYLDKQWGTASGTVVLIDLEENELYIQNSGYLRRSISDESRRNLCFQLEDYVDSGEYYNCFEQSLTQIGDIVVKGKVENPVKYITYALFAFVVALLIMYCVVMVSMKKYGVSEDEWLKNVSIKQDIYNFSEHYLHETKKYVPSSSKYFGRE